MHGVQGIRLQFSPDPPAGLAAKLGPLFLTEGAGDLHVVCVVCPRVDTRRGRAGLLRGPARDRDLTVKCLRHLTFILTLLINC